VARRKQARTHGILAIDKAPGMTSRQVVNRVSGLLEEKRCGHAGTLDPDASGLLVIAFGEATKVVRWLVDASKAYHTNIVFGTATSSDDASGTVVKTVALARPLGREQLLRKAQRELGLIDQVPPAVSALKRDGVRDHERVRRGEAIDRPPRPVRLDAVELVEHGQSEATFVLRCGAGFYVRAWARDLGNAMASAAHVSGLRRLSASGLDAKEAITLEELEDMTLEQRQGRMLPIGTTLSRLMPLVDVDEPTALALQNGQTPAFDGLPPTGNLASAVLVRRAGDHRLVCVASLQRRTVMDEDGEASGDGSELELKVVRGFRGDVALR
jgi:tRNA pseudouridine55 synthase